MSDLEVSDKSTVGLPLRNLIGLASAVAVGTWAWFGLQERLNVLETNQILMAKSVEQNENFRIKWPRGELGALPADAGGNRQRAESCPLQRHAWPPSPPNAAFPAK